MFAGLDVHARSVTGHAMDECTGEVWQRTLSADPAQIWEWLRSLPQPVMATYEAGPTGFGLARFLNGRGIACVVAAPSKLQRPAGNRIKTDARDAELLCRLLRLDEIVEVRLPDVEQEAARDLVRARHRVSKLLLRNGLVYAGGKSWTGAHEHWLHTQRFDSPARQLAFEDALETVLLTTNRRSRLDAAIEAMAADSSYTPLVRRLGCLRGISTLTGFGLAVEIGDWHRFTGSSIGAFLGLVPTEDSSGESRSQGSITKAVTPTPAGCWWRRPGITVRATATPAEPCRNAGSWHPPRPGSAATKAIGGSTCAGKPPRAPQKEHHHCCRRRPRTCRLGLVPGGHAGLTRLRRRQDHSGRRARNDPRATWEQPAKS